MGLGKIIKKKSNEEILLDLSDINFLLKLMVRSTFSGEELVQGYRTYEKLYHKHREGTTNER